MQNQGSPRHQGPPRHGPYPPPAEQRAPFAGSGAGGNNADEDEAVGFVPTVLVNAACIGLVVVALLCFLMMIRLLIHAFGGTAGLIAIGHGVVGLAALAGAIGVRSGRFALTIVGLLACPFAGLASLFALLTGSIVGLWGAGISATALVLGVISLRDVVRMGTARRAIRREQLAEPAMPNAPISTSDLPRVRPRRWPVVVVLLAIIVVGGGGTLFGLRVAARAERDKEIAAFRSLEACLFDGRLPAGVAPSLAYRRTEIRRAPLPVTATPWPARCATHAHALHESKRRAGTASEKESPDTTAFFAERLGRLLGDARGESVYQAVDQLWAAAEKEGYATSSTDAGGAAPAWVDVDALARVAPFSKSRTSLNALHGDRVAAPRLHLLVDGTRQRGEGRLCTLSGSTFRCPALAPPLDESALSLLGGVEGDAAPLLFANGGQVGVFRANGDSVAEMASYGGIARPDGSVGIVGYDRKSSRFVLVRAEKNGAPKSTTFSLEGVSDDRQIAVLDETLAWVTNAGALSVARLLRSGAALAASTELGSIERLGDIESFDGCRTADAFFLRVNGAMASALTIDTGDRWSPLVQVGDGSLACSGKEAFILRQHVRAGGTGSVSLERCTTTRCERQAIDLDEVFQQNVEVLPKYAPLALPLDGKLLLVWRAGVRGGVRMRLAPIEHIAAAEDVIVFDDRVQDGRVSERSNLFELRGWSRPGQAVVFLNTTAGTWALAIDGDGKVTPIETIR